MIARAPRALAAATLLALSCRTGRSYEAADGPRYSVPAPARGATRADTLRVVSFNIAFAREIDAAIALLASDSALAGADVLLLQEMDAPGTARIASALGMGYVYYPAILHLRTKRDFGNAVLSRWPIVGDTKLTLPHRSRYARTHRIATAATLRVGDVPVRVYSTHLGTPADVGARDRREQLAAILDDAASYDRVIIGGDMNSSSVGAVALERGFAWPTRWLPKTTRFGRWDHVFLKGMRPPADPAAGVVPRGGGVSDHHPIWVRAALR